MSYMIDPVKPYAPPTQAFDTGGPVDGQDDTGDTSQAQGAIPTDASSGADQGQGQGSSVDDALSVVKDAMGFRRQQHGLGGGQQTAGAMGPVNAPPAQKGFGSNDQNIYNPDTGKTPPQYQGVAGRKVSDNQYEPRTAPASQSDLNSTGPEAWAGKPQTQGVRPPLQIQPRAPVFGKRKMSALDTGEPDTQSFRAGGSVQQGSDDSTDQANDPAGVVPAQQGSDDNTDQPRNSAASTSLGAQGQASAISETVGNPLTGSPDQSQHGTQRLINYIRGGDGDQNLASQMAKQVDPQGQMDVNERNIAAVGAAANQGGPEASSKVVGANVQSYNAKLAFARAALNGNEGKPADIVASTTAATQAYTHMLDGKSADFTPSRNGVTVTVKGLDETSQPEVTELTTPQYNDLLNMGKNGMYDNVFERGIGPVLQEIKQLPGSPVQAQGQQGQPQQQAQQAQAQQQPQGPGQQQGPGQKQPLTEEQQYAQANGMATRLFPRVSQEAERSKYIQGRMAATAAATAKLEEVKNTHLYGDKLKSDALVTTGAGHDAAKMYSSDNYVAGQNHKADQALAGQLARARSQGANAVDQHLAAVYAAEEKNAGLLGTERSPTSKAIAKHFLEKAEAEDAGGGAPPAVQAAPAGRTAPAPGGAGQTMQRNGQTYYKVQGGWSSQPPR